MTSSEARTIETINDMLDKTQWTLMRPGNPRRITLKEEMTQEGIQRIMNHYRRAGWLVKTSVMVATNKRSYTMEFLNPHYM